MPPCLFRRWLAWTGGKSLDNQNILWATKPSLAVVPGATGHKSKFRTLWYHRQTTLCLCGCCCYWNLSISLLYSIEQIQFNITAATIYSKIQIWMEIFKGNVDSVISAGFANTPKLFRWLFRGYGGSHFDSRNFWQETVYFVLTFFATNTIYVNCKRCKP